MADKITNEDLIRWQAIAQSRLDDGHAADEAACAIIVKLCDELLTVREANKRKPMFENLLHQGSCCVPSENQNSLF